MRDVNSSLSSGQVRIDYIDCFRSIGILFMLMGHVGFSKFFYTYIHAFNMPMFFFASGYMYKNASDIALRSIRKKVRSLLIPYLCFGFINILVNVVIDWPDVNVKPILDLLWDNSNMSIAGSLWFLTALFFAYCIYIILEKFLKYMKVRTMLIFLVALLGSVFSEYVRWLPLSINVSLVAVFYFHLGYLLKINEGSLISNWLLNMKRIPMILIFIINITLIFYNGNVNMRAGIYSNILLFWINSFFAIVFFWNLAKNIDKFLSCKFNRVKIVFYYMGKNSIIFLCANQFYISGLGIILATFLLNKAIYRILLFITVVLLLYGTSYMMVNTRLRWVIGKRK